MSGDEVGATDEILSDGRVFGFDSDLDDGQTSLTEMRRNGEREVPTQWRNGFSLKFLSPKVAKLVVM